MEKKFSYMSEEITTAGGSTGRIIRFDEPIPEKSTRHVESSGICLRTGLPKKKPGPKPKPKGLRALPVEPVVPPQAVPVPKNPLIAPLEATPNFKELGIQAKDDHERSLLCYSAAVNRENEALRKYNEWLTARIETLERRVYELTQGSGGSPVEVKEEPQPVPVVHEWVD